MPFLTPNAPGAFPRSRRFYVDGELWELFMGALYVLTESKHYEQFGSMTPEETADYFSDVVLSFTEDDMVGTVVEYITTDPPEGVLPLDGTTYLIADYPLLASKLEAIFVDSGAGTFTLPDSRERVLVAEGITYNIGDAFGENKHMLTNDELTPHAHTYTAPSGEFLAVGPGETPVVLLAVPFQPTSTEGGGIDHIQAAHENRQPSLVVRRGVWWK